MYQEDGGVAARSIGSAGSKSAARGFKEAVPSTRSCAGPRGRRVLVVAGHARIEERVHFAPGDRHDRDGEPREERAQESGRLVGHPMPQDDHGQANVDDGDEAEGDCSLGNELGHVLIFIKNLNSIIKAEFESLL